MEGLLNSLHGEVPWTVMGLPDVWSGAAIAVYAIMGLGGFLFGACCVGKVQVRVAAHRESGYNAAGPLSFVCVIKALMCCQACCTCWISWVLINIGFGFKLLDCVVPGAGTCCSTWTCISILCNATVIEDDVEAGQPKQAADEGAADVSFTVSVVKTEGKTFKMGIVENAGGKAAVNSIAPDGLIAEYNAANPATAVMTGDIIESVNGATGDATAIKDAIKASADGSTLTIGMKRRVSTTKEFTVELVKADGKPLKVGFAPKGAPAVMVVTSIADDGLMAEYNKKNPASALAVGDFVLEANGSSDVLGAIKNTAAGGKIVMKVKRVQATAKQGEFEFGTKSDPNTGEAIDQFPEDSPVPM